MKLYYDDALKAAWMAREFDVDIYVPEHRWFKDEWHYSAIGLCHELIEEDKMNGRHLRYYVHPDSLPIFEPQVGDWLVEYSQIEPELLRTVSYCVTLDAYTYEPQVALQEGFRTNCGTLDKPSGYSFGGHQWIMKDYKPDYSRYKILQRNGKPFFAPEVE